MLETTLNIIWGGGWSLSKIVMDESELRSIADYNLFTDLTDKDLNRAIIISSIGIIRYLHNLEIFSYNLIFDVCN